ncbi:phosphoglycerate dehydrogenase [Calderihabitans maritimus]|uniref:D-3-phosphoglycerate dehydrogenase n=1 Tax=Calderihabitans maritimus TaxID=1246530 RepID=A0A1Z5HWB1_9FIRM|nr:phosphoglycerate dehydrogenase [Calderihabitans maritimus]GAW93637.1 D-3-phosphoglycerate dehydrogenase [Calderihabitans maritimus]
MRILVSDSISEKGIEILRKEGGYQVDVKTKLSEDELVDIIGDYHALVVRSQTKVTRRIIESARQLKIIGRAGVGIDNIDVDAATERGIVVVNAPEGNTVAATEHTIAMMLALARNIPQANQLLKNGKWERKKFLGVELRGKTLGIIGLGKIGSGVAKRAKAMEMKVLAYDPFISEDRAQRLGVELVDFDRIIKESDFITVHLPLTKETYHMISWQQFEAMKPGVRICNVARGGIVDEEALYEALKSGKVAGAAIDVFEQEPLTESPLFELDNVIVTPHLGASTEEAQVNVAVEVAYDIIAGLRGEPVKNAVNIPSIKPELLKVIQPYVDLVEKLGKFISQVSEGHIKQVEIKYNGEMAQYDVTSLTNTFLKGLLRPVLKDAVNYVNAPLIAKNRGIKVYESKSVELEDYANLITVKVTTDKCEKSVAGTLFGKNEPRIVRIDGYTVDAVPEGHMLVIPHIDKPRIIGPVGNLIGALDVNIAGMQVGRKVIGGKAVMFLNIDAPVPEETLKEIAKIDGILDVKYVHL